MVLLVPLLLVDPGEILMILCLLLPSMLSVIGTVLFGSFGFLSSLELFEILSDFLELLLALLEHTELPGAVASVSGDPPLSADCELSGFADLSSSRALLADML